MVNRKDLTMNTTPALGVGTDLAGATARVAHPVTVGGRARGLWVASRVLGLSVDVAMMAALGYLLTLPVGAAPSAYPSYPVLVVGLLALLGAYLVARRLRWLAWAEVPGAWRTYRSVDQARAAAPDRRLDLGADVVHALVWSVGGVFLAHLPGQAPALAVGFFGGAMTAHAALSFGGAVATRSLDRTPATLLTWVSTITPALVWSAVGDHRLQLLGGAVALVVVLMAFVARQTYGSA